jgi:hypothetical protein
MKMIYPWLYNATLPLAPYAGFYSYYYFTKDDASVLQAGGAQLASEPLLDGWSARTTPGLAARLGSGAQLSAEGELGVIM